MHIVHGLISFDFYWSYSCRQLICITRCRFPWSGIARFIINIYRWWLIRGRWPFAYLLAPAPSGVIVAWPLQLGCADGGMASAAVDGLGTAAPSIGSIIHYSLFPAFPPWLCRLDCAALAAVWDVNSASLFIYPGPCYLFIYLFIFLDLFVCLTKIFLIMAAGGAAAAAAAAAVGLNNSVAYFFLLLFGFS